MPIVMRMKEKTFNLKGESRLMTAAVSSGGFNSPSDSHQDSDFPQEFTQQIDRNAVNCRGHKTHPAPWQM